MLAQAEVQVITLRIGPADSRRAYSPLLLACGDRPPPSGWPARGSETRPMTRRVSDIVDLAAAIRLSAGDDLAPQSRGASSRKVRRTLCLDLNASSSSSDRKAGESGRHGYEILVCSKWPFILEEPRIDYGVGGTPFKARLMARSLSTCL